MRQFLAEGCSARWRAGQQVTAPAPVRAPASRVDADLLHSSAASDVGQRSITMSETLTPINQCDVVNKEALAAYRTKAAKWHRWLRTDTHHALWKQIYSMLIEDLTFRTLSAAAEADPESALNSPILARGLIAGYAALQGLAIRRLVGSDRKVISLCWLVIEIQNSRDVLTREVYVAGTGLPYGPDEALQKALASGLVEGFWAPITGPRLFPSMQAHAIFDMLAGTRPEARSRDDRLPETLYKTLTEWLSDSDITAVVEWSHNLVAHAPPGTESTP